MKGGKFAPVIKIWGTLSPYENRINDIISADVGNFMLTSDKIGLFLQNFKTLEPLNVKSG